MSKGLSLFFSDAKEYLSSEVNRVFVAVIIIGLGLCYLVYSGNNAVLKSNESILKAVQKADKKVDFRYFNTVKSLEEIHNVKIDTHYGELKK